MPFDLPPIPRRDRQALEAEFGTVAIPPQGHAGLIFDRYFRMWDPGGFDAGQVRRSSRTGDASEKDDTRRALQEFIEAYRRLGREQVHRSRLSELHDRLQRLADARWGKRRQFRTKSRLATGMGLDHPLENGFVFDRGLGVPYLPGSSVKGLCRAAALLELDDHDPLFEQIFGTAPPDSEAEPQLAEPPAPASLGNLPTPPSETASGSAPSGTAPPGEPPAGEALSGDASSARIGQVIFLPAWPETWPELAIEVVTNHHRSYYSEAYGRRADRFPPLDVENPLPVYFLTVSADTPFVFGLLPRGRQVSPELLERAMQSLESGLSLLGIGAKTASGLGVMLSDEDA